MSSLKRILVNIAVVFSLFFLPWWIVVIVSIYMCWQCDYYEIILWGFLIDVFYRSQYFFHIGEHYIYGFTLGALVTLFVLRKLKKRVRLNA